jgi:DNA-binding FadR family transcriptional regulator
VPQLYAPHVKLPLVPVSPDAFRHHRQVYLCIEAHDGEMAFLVARRLMRAVLLNLQVLTSDPQVRQSLDTTP